MERVHFISVGGSIMHSLAIALKNMGVSVTGSDDEIYSPSKENLKKNGLLPESYGWHPEKITEDLDAVILGMHAREGNPELEKAKALGLKIYSFPDFIREKSARKQRIVVAGSHGKTTITGIIIHVLNFYGKQFDYMIGAKLKGLEHQVKLSDAPIIVIEGDEYLTSQLDRSPKFLKYEHHIGLISGIAWDHINAFPTLEEYVHQFDIFGDATPKAGSIVFCGEDHLATVIGTKEREDVNRLEYNTHPHEVRDGKTFLKTPHGDVPVQIFGRHNMQNIAGAMTLMKRIGITEEMFYKAISSFETPAKRLQLVNRSDDTSVYSDYAHAPSKVAATTRAVKELYTDRSLIACLELHTFSSLNKEFISQYQESMNMADEAIVFVNPKNIKNKNGMTPEEEDIKSAFAHPNLKVYTDVELVRQDLVSRSWKHKNLVLMSSGNFAGLDLNDLSNQIIDN